MMITESDHDSIQDSITRTCCQTS